MSAVQDTTHHDGPYVGQRVEGRYCTDFGTETGAGSVVDVSHDANGKQLRILAELNGRCHTYPAEAWNRALWSIDRTE